MNILEEIQVSKKYTDGTIKCFLCEYPNNFLIEIIEDKGNYYYMEKCPRPRCNHVEEFRECAPREAKKYLRVAAPEDPSIS